MKARWIFGLALAAVDPRSSEELQQFRRVAKDFPKAHIAAAHVLEQRGDRAAARTELQSYLATDAREQRADVERWVKSLR